MNALTAVARTPRTSPPSPPSRAVRPLPSPSPSCARLSAHPTPSHALPTPAHSPPSLHPHTRVLGAVQTWYEDDGNGGKIKHKDGGAAKKGALPATTRSYPRPRPRPALAPPSAGLAASSPASPCIHTHAHTPHLTPCASPQPWGLGWLLRLIEACLGWARLRGGLGCALALSRPRAP